MVNMRALHNAETFAKRAFLQRSLYVNALLPSTINFPLPNHHQHRMMQQPTATVEFGRAFQEGIWTKNPLLAQCLGLCPLLAVSVSALQALILGLASTAVLVGSCALVALLGSKLPRVLQLQVFIALIASLVTMVDLLLAAWWYEIYLSIGLFIPLIISNCLILGRCEAYAQYHSVRASALDGLRYGIGFAWVLLLLGLLRESLSYGGLQLSLSVLLPQHEVQQPLQLLSLLPPGVFFLLALMVAIYGWLQRWRTAGPNLIAKAC